MATKTRTKKARPLVPLEVSPNADGGLSIRVVCALLSISRASFLRLRQIGDYPPPDYHFKGPKWDIKTHNAAYARIKAKYKDKDI